MTKRPSLCLLVQLCASQSRLSRSWQVPPTVTVRLLYRHLGRLAAREWHTAKCVAHVVALPSESAGRRAPVAAKG